MSSDKETRRLEAVAEDSWYLRPANAAMIKYCAKVFARHIRRGRILELGPAEGVMTVQLAKLAERLTLVEGAPSFCELLRHRFPEAEVVNVLFEEFQPSTTFDYIVLGHVLEHVIDPVAVLKLARAWLAPGGRVLAAVPDARSVHRQAAVIMGLLPVEDAMSEADIHQGHRRIFNPETFRQVFVESGMEIEMFGGFWLKPLSNNQIEHIWTPAMLEAFMKIGERYPDIAAEIYIVARNPEQL